MNDFSKYIHKVDRDNNMDLVRYILAFGVLIGHFNIIMGTEIPWVVSCWDSVFVFFAISGFLLIGLCMKGIPFQQFLYKRFWRLSPSYIFIVLFCAFSFAAVSDLSIVEYFSSSQFYKYIIANLAYINFLEPELPGVFTDFHSSVVNGSLWTMKIEWQLVLIAPIIILLAKKCKFNIVGVSIFFIVASLGVKELFSELYFETNQNIYAIMSRQMWGQLCFFCAGVVVYCYYPHFKRNIIKYLLPISVCYIIFKFTNAEGLFAGHLLFQSVTILMFLLIGMIPNNISRYIDGGHNISYEIYLAHFPVIQVVKHTGIYEQYGMWVAFAVAVIVTIILSITIYLSVGRMYLNRQFKPKVLREQPSI